MIYAALFAVLLVATLCALALAAAVWLLLGLGVTATVACAPSWLVRRLARALHPLVEYEESEDLSRALGLARSEHESMIHTIDLRDLPLNAAVEVLYPDGRIERATAREVTVTREVYDEGYVTREVYDEGYDAGYDKGYEEARENLG